MLRNVILRGPARWNGDGVEGLCSLSAMIRFRNRVLLMLWHCFVDSQSITILWETVCKDVLL